MINATVIAEKMIQTMARSAYLQGVRDGYISKTYFPQHRIFFCDAVQRSYDEGHIIGRTKRYTDDIREEVNNRV